MNQIQKQHAVAVDLLEKLGMDTIKLERQRDGHYTYRAWNTPLAGRNGSAKIVRHGRTRARK